MVLSNKKLKLKLRAEIAESLTSAQEPDPNESSKAAVGLNSQRHSLKQLLNSVTQKPIFSKREKKRFRIHDCLEDSETVNSKNRGGDSKNVEEENKEGGNKKKKRKTNGDESKSLELVGEGENGEKKKRKKKDKEEEEGDEESVDAKEARKLKRKKIKKKQMKKKQRKANKNEEKNKRDDGVVVNEESNNSESQVNGDAATKVYVGGIPYNASENDIKTYFEGCGTITEIDYMTFPDTGKFRGIAIVNFRTEGAAKRALALDGSEMDGLFLKIQPYKLTKANKTFDFAPKILEGYNRIYVGNLSWDITEDDLKKLFSDCKISSIRFGTNKETGEFRGYGHVDFSDSLSLTMALKLDQEIVCGRPVKISCAVPPKKVVNTKSRYEPSNNSGISIVTDNAGTKTSNVADNAGSGAVSGKIRNSVTSIVTDNAGSKTSNVADNAASGAVSGKIRRRTCYECGEKGHLSSACPNKTADQTTS